jgi:hypothetical protein
MNTWNNRASALLINMFMAMLVVFAAVALLSWHLNRDIQPSSTDLKLHNVAM